MAEEIAKTFTEAFKTAVDNYHLSTGKMPGAGFITEKHWNQVRLEVLETTRFKLDDGHSTTFPCDEEGLPVGGFVWFYGVRLIVLNDTGVALL